MRRLAVLSLLAAMPVMQAAVPIGGSFAKSDQDTILLTVDFKTAKGEGRYPANPDQWTGYIAVPWERHDWDEWVQIRDQYSNGHTNKHLFHHQYFGTMYTAYRGNPQSTLRFDFKTPLDTDFPVHLIQHGNQKNLTFYLVYEDKLGLYWVLRNSMGYAVANPENTLVFTWNNQPIPIIKEIEKGKKDKWQYLAFN